MYNGKLGIALISFNRPEYFSQVITALEQQTHLDNTTFHLFQDGALSALSLKTKADKENIKQSIALFQNSSLPKWESIIRVEINVGNGINQFGAKELMSKTYDYFLVIEDDVLLSPDYLRLCRVMIEQFSNTEDLHSFNLGFHRLCPLKKIEKYLDKIVFKDAHWWAECFISKQWLKARPYFLEYYKLIKNCDYSSLPTAKIRSLFHQNGYYNKGQCSQDAGKDYALFRAGLKRLTAVVNRGYYIGEQGIHFTPERYKSMSWDKQKPFAHFPDKSLQGFKLI